MTCSICTPLHTTGGSSGGEVELNLDAELAGLALDDLRGVAHQRVQVERLLLAGLLAHQVPHAPDDLAGAQRLVRHRLQDRQQLRRVAREPLRSRSTAPCA